VSKIQWQYYRNILLVEASTRCSQVHQSRTTYAIAKPTIKKKWLYTSLPTLDSPWESISMDYMFDLPSTKHGNDCVLMVVDQFSEMKILAPCKKSITTKANTKLFFTHVWVYFGLP
jgi:hypothetical protein